ncbi:Ti-type conjugative transfer relaxase TraA [Sphingobium sp. B2D3A]|uniref:Ti-type conjugative transfer relaxase TraA n=1 Tax=unclassified Sphingobium TaxID=2611147 RepID=UPI00222553E4|nr:MULTISPECIES: Ti-type conjugative transfer relaxase TraA [unclassified Sphingobium]MCW2337488.1 Ti-type conjugative transfer relaxase TraA [Sphingobium sp. B2D3A]MCW2383946.1 Ti-type conjugative transfer relaxase TraA [Sphingobium sp. B2D3D]
MAIYHFSAKIISRANGSSALASAAYRSASKLHDQRLDRHHDFSNKAGVVHSEVMLTDGAPEHLGDRETLWNAVEAAELRKDAQLSREIEFAIPRELSPEMGIDLVREFVRREFVDRGMIADVNVHWDVGADGEPKPHAHVMLTMREVGEDGFGAKVRDWNRTDLLNHWREAWADHVNERLAALDIDALIDHRSFEAQGIDLEPQHKIGAAASRMVAKGLKLERVDEHREIARSNGEKILAEPRIALDAITRTQATFTTRDLAMFAHRHSEGKDQFDQVMAAVRASPELVALGKDGRGEDRFTSRGMIQTEQRLARETQALSERQHHRVGERNRGRAITGAERRGLALSAEQRSAFEHVTDAKDLGIVIGYAGTGKSAMLGVAREAWEHAGYQVQGLALSGVAAENLENGSGIASRTIASLEHQWSRGREFLSANHVLVIDEAGMIGSRQMERVIAEAEKRGAKVVLVGDPEQLQAIEAGTAFRSIAERHGGIEITEVRRQREDWQRDATRQLATGRTPEALNAYREAGMVVESETRAEAREALIDRWNRDRFDDPARSRIILTHTNEECDELNGLARDRMKRNGTLVTDIAVKTTRGERLFAAEDRIMFLRNERELGVKNGSLGTVEQVDRSRMAVRLDDGRHVAFELKDYSDVTHGYAATIHKAQGVTVDRAHVLATPGLDRHAAYVALSRHRDALHLHYGRDDFADSDRLARTLSRDRPKDSVLDYEQSATRFAERRGFDRSRILDTLARDRLVDRSHTAPEQRRGRFDGLRLRVPDAADVPTRSRFDGLKLQAPPERRAAERAGALANVVQQYARTVQDIGRMTEQGLSPLEYQKVAKVQAARALDAMQQHGAHDLEAVFAREPGLVSEAANGRTANAIRQMQLETELRTNSELRADRFVQTWQQLRAQRDKLGGWQNEDARGAVEHRMRAMTKGLEKDPALGAALSRRGSELLGRQWSPEWSPGSRDGGIGAAIGDQARTRSFIQQLTFSIERGRNLGIGL